MLIAFWVLFLTAVALAVVFGGAPERSTAAAFFLAAVATLVVRSPWAERYEHVETGVLIVDLALCVPLLVIAIRARRLWPIPVASLQLVVLIGHLGKAANADLHAGGYILLITYPSYLQCGLLIIGTVRHHYRVRRGGAEPSWGQY